MECRAYYDIERCVCWIKEHNFTKIALQFSSDFVEDALPIARYLQNLNLTAFIVAESQFSGCCVDESIAEKANCECVVHFGDCCRTATSERIPVLILPRKEPLEIEALRSCLCNTANEVNFNIAELDTVVLDQRYAHLADIISKQFSTAVRTTEVGVALSLPRNSTALFIGSGSARLNLLALQNPTVHIYSYDPRTERICRENIVVNAQLRRRLYLVEKAKLANIVGVLIGSLSMKDRIKWLSRVRERAKFAKKKCYTFGINRVTPAKLANFPEVDIFVYIGCPYASLIDSSEFYKPIISPFEFDIACSQAVTWNPVDGLLTCFASIEKSKQGKNDDCNVSLITGRIEEACNLTLDDEPSGEQKCTAIECQDFRVEKVMNAVSFYNQRSWKGLEDKAIDEQIHPVSKGRDGWAMEYANEPN
uniref:Uncharacterized protein n=1 Tax=Trichuris muris TaxID=70415 RepID=A0A5S6QVT0_TRIMR